MPSLSSIRASNLSIGSSLPYHPVAIFVGGTAGIGAGMARTFAHHRNGDAHIILVGRNRAAAEEIIASFPKPEGKEVQHEFVECDLTLMRNVRKTTAELKQRLPRVNFLVLSPGIMSFAGRTETDEGIDRKMALHYYARWRFTYDLIPTLQNAKDAGEDAKVLSVLSAGTGEAGPMDLDDLALKKNYSVVMCARACPTYNDLMVQTFADKYPSIAFTHAAPGAVDTNLVHGLTKSHWSGRILHPLSSALLRVFGTSADDCGDYMWHGLYAGTQGWYRRNRHGEDVGDRNMWSTTEAKYKLWEHTLRTTSVQ
ncbi:NAD(P)-dependent dehydrogenase [Phanerochaete sordida]|uniref:NAD(P)-dependent dehydrogenase n=1 Tax=Phanerochaete sordida TaxID=48140 RepID=A0A9P3LB15_9APHY|nr:NAD(P)-dependent dehydrogenase [Phanerochaete sordida]